MSQVIDGSKIANQILSQTAKQVAFLNKKNINPELGVILVGEDKASLSYVAKKEQACKKVGIKFLLKKFLARISTEDLIKEIKKIQRRKNLAGLIVQLPLPKNIDKTAVLNSIDSKFDVDFLSEASLGKLVNGNFETEPPTPGAILEALKKNKVKLKGKRVTVIGAGDLIGRPLVNILMHYGATVFVANEYSRDLAEITKNCDIVVTAVGKRNILKASMVKRGVIIIDAGVSFCRGKVYGDIDFDNLKSKAKIITPTPGGVGPITVAKLVQNVTIFAENRFRK